MQRSPESPSLTFAQFLAEFRTDFGGWSPNTWRGLSGMLRKLEEEFGDQLLESITTREIERYSNAPVAIILSHGKENHR